MNVNFKNCRTETLYSEGTGAFISLFSEIRVSRKGQMFLKYQNRQ